MVKRRSYPRTFLERNDIFTGRSLDYPHSTGDGANCFLPAPVKPRDYKDRNPCPRHKWEEVDPDCVITITKRKGFGTTGEKESAPGSIHASNFLLKQLPPELFYRYRVNIYRKKPR